MGCGTSLRSRQIKSSFIPPGSTKRVEHVHTNDVSSALLARMLPLNEGDGGTPSSVLLGFDSRWFVSSRISLRHASSVEHNDLLCFQNPRIKDLVPRSHTTTSSWLMAKYERHKPTIVQSTANAKSKLTVSLDGWKANNDVLDLLRVVIHYLKDDRHRAFDRARQRRDAP
jgi:hypothetical protein